MPHSPAPTPTRMDALLLLSLLAAAASEPCGHCDAGLECGMCLRLLASDECPQDIERGANGGPRRVCEAPAGAALMPAKAASSAEGGFEVLISRTSCSVETRAAAKIREPNTEMPSSSH